MLNAFLNPLASSVSSLEQNMLYHPYAVLDAEPRDMGLPFQEVYLQTIDGVRLHAWWIPSNGPAPSKTLLYCHGNGGNISHRLDRAQLYHRLGLGILLFDYRGFGKSAGVPNEAGTYQDAEAAWRYLTEEQKIQAGSIVLYGESLGCAIALETALHHPAAGLVLESAFTSTIDMAQRLFPQLPVATLVQNRYDNFKKIKQLRMPLLVLHSPTDQTVPFAMGQALYDAAPTPKTFVRLRGSHMLGYRDSGAAYPAALKEFINSLPH